jgi:AcrR family transcriptional regulator
MQTAQDDPNPGSHVTHEAAFLAAALRLAGEGAFRDARLRDVAVAAGAPTAALFAFAPTKAHLIDRISDDLDGAVFAALDGASDGGPQDPVEDRLFEAVMARLEAMEPHRFALLALLNAEGAPRVRMGRRLARTARAVLAAAGVEADGPAGALRLAAMTGVWGRVVQVWRDDEGALNRTMAEIDLRLKQMKRRLARIGVAL